VQYSRNQAIKNSLNEAIMLMSINEALLSDKTLRLSSNQDLILHEGDSNAQPVKIPYSNTPMTHKQAR